MCCDKMKDFFYLKKMVKIFKKAKMSFYLTDLMSQLLDNMSKNLGSLVKQSLTPGGTSIPARNFLT